MENKFYKVNESGGTLVTADFFNPVTLEEKNEIVRDYDYSDCSRDNDELYYMSIDKEVRHMWLNRHGIIDVGNVVRVTKGRKVPIGTVATVTKMKKIYDKYDRYVCTYAYFDNGMRTNVDNCTIVK